MAQKLEDILLKIRNRYEVRKLITSIKPGYRIGIGKIIEVTSSETTTLEVEEDIKRDAKPYSIWFY